MSQCNPRVLVSRARTLKSEQYIKILARVKPETESELSKSEDNAVEQATPEEDCISDVEGKPDPYTLTFDHVFDKKSSQIDVFNVAGIPTVENVLTGYNSTIVAYGEKRVGKTYTTVGNLNDQEQQGLVPRMLEHLFKRIEIEEAAKNSPPNYRVVYSNFGIYNETITDLLNPNSTNLQIRDDTKFGSGVYVKGLKEVGVKSSEEVIELLKEGMKNGTKITDSGNMSFTKSIKIYSFFITRKEQSQLDGSEKTRVSRLILVDLASCERIKGTDMKDPETVREICFLNKTHSTLGRVFDSLIEKNSKPMTHVPYRDSKLTFYLKESFGGNARTTIIAGAPSMCCLSGESLSTLQFVQRAKCIKNKAKVNEVLKHDPVAIQMEVMKPSDQIEKMEKGGYRQDPNDRSSVSCSTPDPDPELESKSRENEEKLESEREVVLEKEKQEGDAEISKPEEELRDLEAPSSQLQTTNSKLQSSLDITNAVLSTNELERLSNEHCNVNAASKVSMAKSEELELVEADGQVNEQRNQPASLQSKLERTIAKLAESESNNATLTQTIRSLEQSGSETKRKLRETELYVQQLERDKQDLKTEVECQEQKCGDLEEKLSAATEQMKEQRSQLAARDNEVERVQFKLEQCETDNARLRRNIESLEITNAELKKKLYETELPAQKLEEEERALDTEQEMVQNQREDLQVERYAALSKKQKEDAVSLQTKFDQTCLELQQEITEKDKKPQKAKENFNAQLAARKAELAKVIKEFHGMIVKYQDSFLSYFNNGGEDNINKTRKFISETIETNSKEEERLVILDRTSFERDQQTMSPMDNIRSTLQKIKTMESEVTAKHHANLKAFYYDPEDQVSSFQSESAQHESTSANEDFQNKQVFENQILQLEALMRHCEQLASDKQTVIEFYMNQIQEIKQEVGKYFSEVNCGKIEAQEFNLNHETEDSVDFKNNEDIVGRLKGQLECKERKIAELEAQLNAELERNGLFHLPDINSIRKMSSSHKCAFFRALEDIKEILKETGLLVPEFVMNAFVNFDEDMA